MDTPINNHTEINDTNMDTAINNHTEINGTNDNTHLNPVQPDPIQITEINPSIESIHHPTDHQSMTHTQVLEQKDTESTSELPDPISDPNDILYNAPIHLSTANKYTGKPISESVIQSRCMKYMTEHKLSIPQYAEQCGVHDNNYLRVWLTGKGKTIPHYTFRLLTILLQHNYITEYEYGGKIHDWVMKDRHYKTLKRPERIYSSDTAQQSNAIHTTDISTMNSEYIYQLSDGTYNYPLCQYQLNNSNQLCHTTAPLSCRYSMCGKHCYLHQSRFISAPCTIHPADHDTNDYDIDGVYENMNVNELNQTYNEVHGYINTRSGLISGISTQPNHKQYPEYTPNTTIDQRVQCHQCESYLGISDRVRLAQCTVCSTVQPIQYNERHELSAALPSNIGSNNNAAASLSAQCQQWTTSQVLVFLHNLQLSHLKQYFEYNYIDGKQLLQLDGGMLRETLGIRNERDVNALLGAIKILTDK